MLVYQRVQFNTKVLPGPGKYSQFLMRFFLPKKACDQDAKQTYHTTSMLDVPALLDYLSVDDLGMVRMVTRSCQKFVVLGTATWLASNGHHHVYRQQCCYTRGVASGT